MTNVPPNMTQEEYAKLQDLRRKLESSVTMTNDEYLELRELNQKSISHLRFMHSV